MKQWIHPDQEIVFGHRYKVFPTLPYFTFIDLTVRRQRYYRRGI